MQHFTPNDRHTWWGHLSPLCTHRCFPSLLSPFFSLFFLTFPLTGFILFPSFRHSFPAQPTSAWTVAASWTDIGKWSGASVVKEIHMWWATETTMEAPRCSYETTVRNYRSCDRVHCPQQRRRWCRVAWIWRRLEWLVHRVAGRDPVLAGDGRTERRRVAGRGYVGDLGAGSDEVFFSAIICVRNNWEIGNVHYFWVWGKDNGLSLPCDYYRVLVK